jgi:Ca2+:H+ antiporter
LLGAGRHHEQRLKQSGVSASLATLAAISVLTMVLPNYTTTVQGPSYSTSQLAFIAVVALVLYGTFVLVQTVRHRDYFLPHPAAPTQPEGNALHYAEQRATVQAAEGDEDDDDKSLHAAPPGRAVAIASATLLVACLGAVVLLAKKLAPALGAGVSAIGAPEALVGVIIAAVVLLPEGLAAVRAARANRLQTSLNLALGSALAGIGLSIPAVAIVSIATGWTLTLGLDARSTVLLMLSLVVATLSLGTGRTTVLQGVVHLVLFAVYLFTTIVP